MKSTTIIISFCVIATLSGFAFAGKKPAAELNWNPKEEGGYSETPCFEIEQHQWPDMSEKTDRANRMRRTDPFSEFNSDDGKDEKSVRVTLFKGFEGQPCEKPH